MNKLTTEQYAAARRMIDEEVIGAYRSHKGKILDGWYDKLAAVLQFTEPEVFGSTLGPIPTEDEIKGQYVGVPGVVPYPVKEGLNNGHCPTCGANYTKPDVPFSHKSAAGNLMLGHADIPTTPAKRIPLYGLSMWEVSAAEKEINPVFDEIEDLLWDEVPVADEYNDPVSLHNTLVLAGFVRGKEVKE